MPSSLTPPSWRPGITGRVHEVFDGLGGRAGAIGLAVVVAVAGGGFLAVRGSVESTVASPSAAAPAARAGTELAVSPDATDPGNAGSTTPRQRRPRAPAPGTDLAGIRKRAGSLAQRVETAPPLTLRIGSFNILGTQHTGPGGDKGPEWGSGAARLPGAIERITSLQVSIVGLQEAQPDQIVGLTAGTGFAAYPGSEVGSANQVNTILYDPAAYDFVSGTTFLMSNGHGVRAQPILRLRDKATQREFLVVNTHPPSGRDKASVVRRAQSHQLLASVLTTLIKGDVPVLLTGDMNERADFVGRVLRPTGMLDARSATGYPSRTPVDWIAGSPGVVFSSYLLDTATTARRISDHSFVTATAILGAAPGTTG